MKDIKKFFETKTYSHLLLILVILLIAWIIFAAGIFIGYHKAVFLNDWDDSYRQGMMNPNSPLAPFMHNSDEVNPHGAMGEIVSVNFPVIMIKGPESAEQVVIISSTTMIRILHGMASVNDIKNGQYVVAVGEPNNKGEIQATFIRIVPPPPIRINTLIISTSTNK